MIRDGSPRLGVIPARAGSSRFPGKCLAPINGKPMIQWVWEAASRAARLTEVVVATDDPAIVRKVEGFGGKAVLTGPAQSGTDRVACIAKDSEASIVVNLQGDEPLLAPESLDRL